MDWSAVAALILLVVLLFEILQRVILPWRQKPRIKAIYPDGSTTSSKPRNTKTPVTVYLKHIGGGLKSKGRATKDLWVYCLFPPSFDVIEGSFSNEPPSQQIGQNPPSGELAEYKYVVVGRCWLVPGNAQEVSVTVKTPDIAETYPIYYEVAEGTELAYLGRSGLSLTIH